MFGNIASLLQKFIYVTVRFVDFGNPRNFQGIREITVSLRDF